METLSKYRKHKIPISNMNYMILVCWNSWRKRRKLLSPFVDFAVDFAVSKLRCSTKGIEKEGKRGRIAGVDEGIICEC